MKNLFLLATLLVSSFTLANNSEKNESVDYIFVDSECFYRECSVITTVGSDGNTYTEKVCGPWVAVVCPIEL